MKSLWIKLGGVPPRRLGAARLELHRAVQIVADVGRSYGPAKPDDSHTNLGFLPTRRTFAGRVTPGRKAARALVQASPLRLIVEGTQGPRKVTLGMLPLAGVLSNNASAWVETAIRQHVGDHRSRPLSRFSFPIPPGPGAADRPFAGEPAAHFQELAAWYANARGLLNAIRTSMAGASTVRCWPHHFDIAFLLPVSRGRGRSRGSIGVGLSPGDEHYAEPYWYVTPWPLADSPILPPLKSGGRWHTAGWIGAVLTGGRLVTAGGGREQASAAREFLTNAAIHCRKLIAAANDKA